MVFVGYGVQAPEFQWDDFKGLDVKGKTLIVLVNDPPIPLDPAKPDALNPNVFGGNAMTYYGRWTYKYDKAAELGAAGCFIVHETGPAGYGFNVVQGFGGERFDLVTPDGNMSKAAIQGWLSLESATALVKASGQDLAELKAQAKTREFKPVPLGATASMSFQQTRRTIDSQNVIGKIAGQRPGPPNEYVVYMAHWDHLGVGTAVNGDDDLQRRPRQRERCRADARDRARVQESAAGAEAHDSLRRRHRRGVWVCSALGTTRRFRCTRSPRRWPSSTWTTVNVWGRTTDVTIVGLGASDLDTYAREAAAEQTRMLRPDAGARKGFLLPIRSLQLREGRSAGVLRERGLGVRRPAGRLRSRKARRSGPRPTTTRRPTR